MTPEEFTDCFDRFAYSTFRLETQQVYREPSELERIEAWRRGAPRPVRSIGTSPWLRRIALDTVAGKQWRRVHVVDEPLSEYVRYEMGGYVESQAVGEEIRLAYRSADARLAGADEDFWLFDGDGEKAYAVSMRYDEGRHVGDELVTDPARLWRYRELRDAAWEVGIQVNAFIAELARPQGATT